MKKKQGRKIIRRIAPPLPTSLDFPDYWLRVLSTTQSFRFEIRFHATRDEMAVWAAKEGGTSITRRKPENLPLKWLLLKLRVLVGNNSTTYLSRNLHCERVEIQTRENRKKTGEIGKGMKGKLKRGEGEKESQNRGEQAFGSSHHLDMNGALWEIILQRSDSGVATAHASFGSYAR